MKKLFTLLCILALSLTTVSVHANTVTIPNDPATALSPTNYLPTALNTGTTSSAGTFSVSQQLYFASELSAASSTTITAITFYCNNGFKVNRKLRVWMNNTSITAFSTSTTEPNFVDPGTFVYSSKKGDTDSGVDIERGEAYTLTFDTSFEWDGTSNIIVTVFDSTGATSGYLTPHDMIRTEGVARFLHQRTLATNYADAGWNMSSLTSATARSSNDRGYVNKITFTFAAPAAVAPSTPDDLAVSATTASSATLAWSAVEGATAYDLEQSADNENWSTLDSNVSGTSFEWTGLSASSTQYARISAKNANGSSAWSSAVTVTTDAAHEHNGISFNKWVSTTSMPTSGNYYLTNDVAYDFYEGGYLNLNGDLNLCLNGHTINLGTKSINVTADHTMTIYDPVGGGKITGFVPGHAGSLDYMGVISVENNGTLVFREGEVENTYPDDDPDYKSIAIAVGGTLILSGAPVISSNEMDIYLPPTIPAKVITIESGKPLTNTTPYKVYKSSGVITSGWTNMSGADPADYFESANSDSPIVRLVDGEAKLVSVITLSENSDNTKKITDNVSVESDIRLTRSLTSLQYNTFCLPFALSDDELQEAFGAGYDLQEFVSSSLVDETLELNFNKVYALEAGKPYLLKPSVNVANPIFQGVTITETEPVDQTSDTYISFYGIYSPTVLEGGNQNILFLGAENELFWPETTENLRGFRAYFEVKGGVSKIAKRARIVNKEDAATNLDKVQGNNLQRTKYIENGQLFILYNGTKYNVQGQVIK